MWKMLILGLVHEHDPENAQASERACPVYSSVVRRAPLPWSEHLYPASKVTSSNLETGHP